MTNLKLITTETFGDLSCNFYRNMNDDILLTREQIGIALDYKYPDDALSKIHKRHSDRLDPLLTVARLASTDGKYYDTILYNERGVMEICRWSNKPKANLFMDWVWDIIEKYRHNELQPNIQPLIDSLSILTQTITTMQQDINTLKESQLQKKLPEKKYSRWKTNTFNKLNTLLLCKYSFRRKTLNCQKIIHLVTQETEDIYNIEINDYVEVYKSEFNLDTKPYTIDAINHYKDIKDKFTLAFDSIMNRLNLSDNTKSVSKNIFDILAEEINNISTNKAS